MGCGVSRIDANGMALPTRLRPLFISRFEEMTARKHNRAGLREPTHSKKELLHDRDDDDRASSLQDNVMKSMPPSPEDSVRRGKKPEEAKTKEPEKPKHESCVKENGEGHKDGTSSIETGKNDKEKNAMEATKAKEKDKIDNADANKKDIDENDDDDEEDDDDDDERMISHEDDTAYPGSPSFRVYFEDNEGNEPHEAVKNDAFFKETVENDEVISSKEFSVDEKEIKRGRKKRSFKMLPKGGQAAVKKFINVNSCYHSSHASHDQIHLLNGKTNT